MNTIKVPSLQTGVFSRSHVVLLLMMLYAMIGFPNFDRDADIGTDYIDPWNRVVWLALLVLAMPLSAEQWRRAWALTRASWALLILYAFFAMSVLWALDPDAALRRVLLTFIQLAVSIFLVAGLRRAGTLHLILAIACAIAMFANLATWTTMPGFAMTDEGFAGLQPQKNVAGMVLMYGLMAVGSGFFLVRGRVLRLTVVVTVLLMVGMLIATRSTTSQGIILAAIVVIPAIIGLSRLRVGLAGSIVMGLATAILAGMLGYLAWCSITGTDPMLPFRNATFSSRTDLWTFVVGEIRKRPWLGAGYSSFWSINPAVQPSLKTDMWFGTDALINESHEGYLDLLATTGIIGFTLGLFVVIRTIMLALRAIRRTQPAETAWRNGSLPFPTAAFHLTLLFGLLIHNFTESNLFSNTSFVELAFVLCALDLDKWRIGTRQPAIRLARVMQPPPMRDAAGVAAQEP